MLNETASSTEDRPALRSTVRSTPDDAQHNEIREMVMTVLSIERETFEDDKMPKDNLLLIGQDSRLPDVRIGLATGWVVTRMGDVFGPPVNLAARLTAVARRNRVIVDNATAAALRRDDYDTRRLTARPLRGFGLVEPVAVRRR